MTSAPAPLKKPFTSAELRDWLRQWIASAAGVPLSEVTDDRPMEQIGLSSRDVVVMSGQLETMTGVHLEATVAYEHPTIASLSDFIMGGGASGSPQASSAPESTYTSASRATSDLDHDIAIVGMSVRLPGADNLDELWDMVVSGADGISDPPADRWTEYSSDEEFTSRMKGMPLKGGYLQNIADFDTEFFGISPLEAANMDPQQRILLELTWEALEHARIPADTLRGESVGVFIGTTNNDYGMLIASDPAEAHPYSLTGCSTSVVANRINYAFDFRGPSVAVDTACSSSLVAIHQAVRALRDGQADAAVAGGVNILANPMGTVAFGELGVLSPTGKIHAFSADADGIVRSDGAGIIILKRLTDARRDGDRILGVIKGSAINSDGRSNGITAPNPEAQVDVLQRAYRDAAIDPRTVDYIEAHGTGTILGDPIEASAVGRVVGLNRDAANPVLLGSAKTNFGHTEAAAGVAGVIKVVLAMLHDTVPPTANYTAPNPYIDFDGSHIEVVEDPREWPEYSGQPLAGVSGFGFGGTNAHVIIAAADPKQDQPTPSALDSMAGGKFGLNNAEHVLLPVSGLLPSRRRRGAKQLAHWVSETLAPKIGADAGREQLLPFSRALAHRANARSRAIAVVDTVEAAQTALERIAEGKTNPAVMAADAPAQGGVVWVYTGFGSQHRKMAKDLYEESLLFQRRIDELDQIIQRESGWSVVDLITDDEKTYDTESAQVAISAIQIALTDYLRAAGAEPAGVVPMSMGEIAAAYAAGGLTADDAMTIACHRSRLMGEGEASLPEDQRGAMAVVEFSVEDLDNFIAKNPEYSEVEPAVYAAPGMITVGGPAEPVGRLVELLEEKGKFARLLNVRGAGHTSALDPILAELYSECAGVTPQPLKLPLYSSVDRGKVYQPGEVVHDAEYFVRCTRHPVWFGDAAGLAFDAGVRTFIELSPNPVGLMQLMQTAFAHGAGDARLIHMLKRKEPATQSIQNVLARLWVDGHIDDLRPVIGSGELVDLPTMNWKHQRFWTDARPQGSGGRGMPGARVALPDGRIAFSVSADVVPSFAALVEAAVEREMPGAQVVNLQEAAQLGRSGDITTVVSKTLGGLSISVAMIDNTSVTTIGEAFAIAPSTGGATTPVNTAAQATQPGLGGALPAQSAGQDDSDASASKVGAFTAHDESNSSRWDPESGETVEDRLGSIVSESMGYDVSDLPRELPLIDLGLDSLMGMRIKNRIEYEFNIPPLQVQALRDASVDDVVTLVENLVSDPKAAEGSSSASTDIGDGPAANTSVATPAGDSAEPLSQAAEGGVGVAPRDASERMVFGTVAGVVGKAPSGVTSALKLTEDQARQIAERLNDRAGTDLDAAEVQQAPAIEDIANTVREAFETDVEGNIRILQAPTEGAARTPIFLFHPAGGSSTVYQPLTRRLPNDVPVYGVERLEGTLKDRAQQYVDDIAALVPSKADGGTGSVVLGGWSFGGFLAYEVAAQLADRGIRVARLVLLDAVRPAKEIPNTSEELHARWDRYAAFAKKTYGLDFPVPHELLDEHGEQAMIELLAEVLASTDPAEHHLSAGVLEHQRASFVDNRIMDSVDPTRWAELDVPVTIFRAERMHDGAIELEPAYADIAPDGGWGEIVDDLEVVQLKGDHLAVVDEPEISKVGERVSEILAQLDGTTSTDA